MLRRGQRITFQERLDITERAAAGKSDPEIATVLHCSLWTVRKWRRIGQRQGRSGRPFEHHLSSAARCYLAHAARASWLGIRYPPRGITGRSLLERSAPAKSITHRRTAQIR